MSPLDMLPVRTLGAGGTILCLAALPAVAFSPQAALTGWLAAFIFVSALPIGSLCLVMVMRIAPGAWRDELAPTAEASMLLLPLAFVAVLPILIGLPKIYEWAGGQTSGFKQYYLSPGFFILRTLLALAGACGLGRLLVRRREGVLALAAGGLIAFVILDGLLATDWLMSLDPRFHSSGFGLYILSAQMLASLSMLIVLRVASGPLQEPGILGGLLLTAILLWAYLSFMQYFIIWSGNLVPGAVWFQRRGTGIWAAAEPAMALLHLLPALLLLFPPVRRSPRWLVALCLAVLSGKLIEFAWLTMPALPAGGSIALLSYLLVLVGLGLLALAMLSRSRFLLARLRAEHSGEPAA